MQSALSFDASKTTPSKGDLYFRLRGVNCARYRLGGPLFLFQVLALSLLRIIEGIAVNGDPENEADQVIKFLQGEEIQM